MTPHNIVVLIGIVIAPLKVTKSIVLWVEVLMVDLGVPVGVWQEGCGHEAVNEELVPAVSLAAVKRYLHVAA